MTSEAAKIADYEDRLVKLARDLAADLRAVRSAQIRQMPSSSVRAAVLYMDRQCARKVEGWTTQTRDAVKRALTEKLPAIVAETFPEDGPADRRERELLALRDFLTYLNWAHDVETTKKSL